MTALQHQATAGVCRISRGTRGGRPDLVSPAENLFRVSRVESLGYHDHDLCWDRLLAALARQRWRGAIVGPHGSGKTTLLLELEQLLVAGGHDVHRIFLNSSQPPAAAWSIPAPRLRNAIVLLDGAEQLGPIYWRRFLRHVRAAAGLVITTHRAGRLPALYHCRPTHPTLDHLLGELCGVHAEKFRPLAHRIFEEENGNLRTVFFRLYDTCAGRVPGEDAPC